MSSRGKKHGRRQAHIDPKRVANVVLKAVGNENGWTSNEHRRLSGLLGTYLHEERQLTLREVAEKLREIGGRDAEVAAAFVDTLRSKPVRKPPLARAVLAALEEPLPSSDCPQS